MSSILSERKRFNYNLNTTHNIRNSNSQKKLIVQTSINVPTYYHPKDENASKQTAKDQNKKIEELEEINRRLVEDTTLQFKKLESDVQRVQKILQEKDLLIVQLQNQKRQLKQELYEVNSQKNILIQAIFEKDLVIKQYEAKLQQLLNTKQTSIPQLSFSRQASTISVTVHLQDSQTQTDIFQLQQHKNTEANVQNQRNMQLQDELFQVRQELFDARNKVKLITQQFEAYRILKQIESIQQL